MKKFTDEMAQQLVDDNEQALTAAQFDVYGLNAEFIWFRTETSDVTLALPSSSFGEPSAAEVTWGSSDSTMGRTDAVQNFATGITVVVRMVLRANDMVSVENA